MPSGAWLWRAVVGLGLALAWGTAAPAADGDPPKQPAQARLLYHRFRSFKIPITFEEVQRSRLKEVLLYASADSGQTWELAGRTTPDQPAFTFKATRDAEYWFAVRTVDSKGRAFPADDQSIEPMLRVVVDTVAPTVMLEPGTRSGGRASV